MKKNNSSKIQKNNRMVINEPLLSQEPQTGSTYTNTDNELIVKKLTGFFLASALKTYYTHYYFSSCYFIDSIDIFRWSEKSKLISTRDTTFSSMIHLFLSKSNKKDCGWPHFQIARK